MREGGAVILILMNILKDTNINTMHFIKVSRFFLPTRSVNSLVIAIDASNNKIVIAICGSDIPVARSSLLDICLSTDLGRASIALDVIVSISRQIGEQVTKERE